MQETTLLRLAIVIAFVGISGLLIISLNSSFPERAVLENNQNYLIKGSITRITERESVTYIDLQKEDELTVVLFKDYPVDLHQGEYVEVLGKTSEDNKGEQQFIAKEIRIIK